MGERALRWVVGKYILPQSPFGVTDQEGAQAVFEGREADRLLVKVVQGENEGGEAALDVTKGNPTRAPYPRAAEPGFRQIGHQSGARQKNLVLGLSLARVQGRARIAVQPHGGAMGARVE